MCLLPRSGASASAPAQGRAVTVRLVVAAAVIAAVSACGSLRGSWHQPGLATPPSVATDNPPAPPQPAPSTPPETSSEISPPSGSDAVIAPCLQPEAKSKQKAKPKPKPARKEAPPQPPTAPAVTEIAPGTMVDAQVKPMPVSVMSILGKRVEGANGEDLGRVVDVLADAGGRVRVAIIDFGGFLGVGDHRIAVDWPLLRFNPDRRNPSLVLSVSRDKLKTAPEYKENPRPQALMEPSDPARDSNSPAAAEPPAPADSKK
ncbi:MAG: PRC-barrel domain-containing protein [Pseudomonadota bacterium]|nr:PRC-barrel domain-containing protein [Pseudomonadota bacterium]